MKLYILYYDSDFGSSEEWNIFYTPSEVYGTKEQVQKRKKFIESLSAPYKCEIVEVDMSDIKIDIIPSVIEEYLEDSED